MTSPIRLYNTATRTIEELKPIAPPSVTMYNCGPTVYNFPHIGNLRPYVFADILRRVLEQNGYIVNQVINITDVGHLVSDADDGEDKMIIGATREGKTIEEIIACYSDAFYDDLTALNIHASKNRGVEKYFPRATHHIHEQITLIETLTQKGYTYTTSDGIYFDTSKFSRYPIFARLDLKGLQEGARVEVNSEKKHPTDFALWKFSPSDGKQREQEWDSPLGIHKKGFPGWHIECSAMAMKYLGETIDIHTGGVDHISVHHTNEIAQSECATDKPFANMWMHSAHMLVDGQKMSKSLGNTYLRSDLAKEGVSDLGFRYWLLTASYRTQVNFTWEALSASETAYRRLYNLIANLGDTLGTSDEAYLARFTDIINNDLDTPSAIALLWEMTRDTTLTNENKIATIFAFDMVLGLDLEKKYNAIKHLLFPPEVAMLLEKRKTARTEKNFEESDRLRDEIKKHGYEVKDTPDGQRLEEIQK